MKIPRITLLFLIFFLDFVQGFTQDNITGRVVYQLEGNSSPQGTIELWFSKDTYRYNYLKSDFESYIERKKGAYTSIKDSLDDIERLKAEKNNNGKSGPESWYGELTNNIVTYNFFNRGDQKIYCIADTIDKFMQWVLSPDTMTIRGIFCQKATGSYNGMNYIAWFAPSIPIPVCHMIYRGLPGLLIQSTNISKKITFGMIDLEWPAKQPIELRRCFESGIAVTRNEFTSIINKQNEKAAKIMEAFEKAKKEGKTLNIKDLLKDNK